MTIPCGTEVYNISSLNVKSRGVCYSDHELNSCLEGRVSDVLFDEEGIRQLEINLSSIADTGFEVESVKRILYSKRKPENWRVGEALAESYLIDHRDCLFPWSGSRDQKNANSSLTGADIVGFHEMVDQDSRFAFGEVKTSGQETYPPSVIKGPHGLKQQLKNLCEDNNIKDDLVKYLRFHINSSFWEKHFKDAFKRYINNTKDVSLFGFLVRDVKPRKNDLHNITKELATNSSPPISIELLALYLPGSSIESLSSKIMSANIKGDK